MAAAYEDLRRAGPERADQVRRVVDTYLVPWFAPKTKTVSDITSTAWRPRATRR